MGGKKMEWIGYVFIVFAVIAFLCMALAPYARKSIE
jgi:hypothetical protein